jgi:hypothetical protein
MFDDFSDFGWNPGHGCGNTAVVGNLISGKGCRFTNNKSDSALRLALIGPLHSQRSDLLSGSLFALAILRPGLSGAMISP